MFEIYEEHEQAKLDAAGLSDVTFKVGYRVRGDKTRLEAWLTGPLESQMKAHKLLPFSDAE